MAKKDLEEKKPLFGLRGLFIPIAIIICVVVFFLSYNTYLVDHSLEDMKFALEQTARAQGIADIEKISLLVDDVLINEVSSVNINSLSVTRLEFVRNVVSKGGVKEQINDAEFLLNKLVKAKEKKRGTIFLALDRMNNDIQNFIRFLTKELPAGILKPEIFKSVVKIDTSILDIAKKYEENWQLPEAISAYEEFMLKYPSYPKLRLVKLQLADVYFKSGDYRGARRLYEKIIQEMPQSDEAKVANVLLLKVKDRIKKQSEKKKLDETISQLVKSTTDEKDYKELGLIDAYLSKLDKETRDLIVYVMEGIEPVQSDTGKVDLSLIDSAKKLEEDWRLAEAQAVYENFIAKYPDYESLVTVKFMLAGVYLKSMQYERALKQYGDIVENYPDSKEAGLAKELISRTEEVISVYKKRKILLDNILKLKTGPDLAQAYYNLGMVNIYIFDLQNAEIAFRRVMELLPNSELAKKSEFILGWVYKFGAKYDKGITTFSKFIEKYPNDPLMIDSAYHIADTYYKSGKFEEAAKVYETFSDKFASSPLSEVALTQAGYTYLYNLHDPLKASQAFAKLKARYPDTDTTNYVSAVLAPTAERSYRDYGFILLKEGKAREAKEAFENAVRVNSQDAWAHCGLGTACIFLILHEEAVEHSATGVKRIKDEYTHAALAFAYDEKGDYLKAIEEYKRSIQKNPDYAVPHYNLGRDYMLMGWYDAAIDEFKIALKLLPNFAEAHNNIGAAYWYRGQTVEAEFEFKTALNSSPDLAEAHYNLGVLYEVSGKYTKAANHFRRALSALPGLDSIKKRLKRIEMKIRR